MAARIGPPLQGSEAVELAVRCQAMIRQMALHFSLGFRSFYCSVPLLMYAAGEGAFLVGSILILGWLIYIDHAAAAL